MISKKYKCIHVHINKTAGSSIETMLEYNDSGADHRTIHEYKDVLGEDIQKYFTFAFVRNPWDKMVSQFHHRKQNEKDKRIQQMDFKSWVKNIDDFHVIMGTGNQLNWLCDKKWVWHPGKKTYISNPTNFKVIVDYIGKFENFSADWEKVCKKIGLTTETVHRRKSNHDDYRKYYDDESTQIIFNRFEADIKFFKYKF